VTKGTEFNYDARRDEAGQWGPLAAKSKVPLPLVLDPETNKIIGQFDVFAEGFDLRAKDLWTKYVRK